MPYAFNDSQENACVSCITSLLFYVRSLNEHTNQLDLHDGNWRNETSGTLIDRLSKLGGPELLAFFLAYDAKLQELLVECDVCSDDDAWHAYINPWNALLENIALTYGYAAARQVPGSNPSQDDDTFAPYDVENADSP